MAQHCYYFNRNYACSTSILFQLQSGLFSAISKDLLLQRISLTLECE